MTDSVWTSITPTSTNPFDPRVDPGRYDDYESIRGLQAALAAKAQTGAACDCPCHRAPVDAGGCEFCGDAASHAHATGGDE